jgi:hypothetical protein
VKRAAWRWVAFAVAASAGVGCGAPAADGARTSGAIEGEVPAEAFGELFDIAQETKASADEEGRPYDSPESFIDDVVSEAETREVDLSADDVAAVRTALSTEAESAPITEVLGQFENLADVEAHGRTTADILKAYTASVQESLAEMIGAGADQSLPANHVGAPVLRQEVNYSCGNNAALSELRFWRPL